MYKRKKTINYSAMLAPETSVPKVTKIRFYYDIA